jgi:hypothetical protein
MSFRDTILRLAREVGLWEMLEGYSSEYGSLDAEEDCLPDLERFAALVAAHERQRICAMLRERHKQEERHNYYGFIARMIEESS